MTPAMTWQTFVVTYGYDADGHELGAAVGQSVDAIERVRVGGKCQHGPRREFSELFTLWHGYAPTEADWPPPRRFGDTYEWQAPELAIVASLVGRSSTRQIAAVLTARLRRVTGDPAACRPAARVIAAMQKVGLSTHDLLGGLSTTDAAVRAHTSTNLIYQEIRRGKLKTFRVGHRLVIPVAALDAWKASRLPEPPKGWIKLWDIRHQLGFSGVGEGLSWKARKGLIPQALFCAGFRWWIPPAVAHDLLRRKKLGLAMPWRGHVEPTTARRSFELWQSRRHAHCAECAAIWNTVGGEPRTFEVFYPRWMQIPEDRKRHLTAPDGLSATRAADLYGFERHTLTLAIANGIVPATRVGAKYVITRADLQRWLKRRTSHQPLTLLHAASRAGIPLSAVRAAIRRGEVKTVRRHDGRPGLHAREVMRLRVSRGGLSVSEAATRCEVSVPTFLKDAQAHGWIKGQTITVAFVRHLAKRRNAGWQLTFEAAAQRLGVSLDWIERAIEQGHLAILRGVDARRRLVGRKRVDALRRTGLPILTERVETEGWLLLTQTRALAGVSVTTVLRWKTLGWLTTKPAHRGVYFSDTSLRAAARRHWAAKRYRFKQAPAWLQAERPSSTAAA